MMHRNFKIYHTQQQEGVVKYVKNDMQGKISNTEYISYKTRRVEETEHTSLLVTRLPVFLSQ